LNGIGALIAVIGSLWAAHLAYRSESWEAACYEENICDSLTFTVVGELLDQGQTPYLEDIRRDHISRTRLSGAPPAFDLPFQYPPNALPLFAIRTMSSPRLVHTATGFLTTLVCLLLFSRLICSTLADDPRAAMLMSSVALSGIVTLNAELGQTGLLAAALVIGMTLWWRRSPIASGLLLGLLAFKPQYAAPALIVAILRRDWRVLAGAALTFTISTLVSGLWYGFDQWTWFLNAVGQSNHTLPWMINWMGAAWRVSPAAQELIQRAAVPMFAASAVALAAMLWPLRRRTSIEGQLGVVMAWAVLFSPNTHPYDVLVLAPALVYVRQQSRLPRIGLLFFLLSWCTLPQPSRWAIVLLLMGFAVLCTFLLHREADAQRDSPWTRAPGLPPRRNQQQRPGAAVALSPSDP
jgi:hypothetical protein